MDKKDLKPRTEDKDLLEDIYDAMKNEGRRLLLVKPSEDLPAGAPELTLAKLEATIEVPESSETKSVKVFEGFHLRDFAQFIAPPGTWDSHAGKPIRSNLEAKLSEIVGRPIKYKYIQDFASETSVSDKSPRQIFQALANVQKDTTITHCLLQFLKFCYERYLPLRMFKEREALEEYIEGLETYIKNYGKEAITESDIPLKDPPYILKSVSKVKSNNGNEIDLNPYNLNSIPLFGREKQLDILNDFLKPKQTLFSIMAIVGPSGAGKTRLVTEWYVENFINNADALQWQAGFIDSSDITPWQKWTPTCNTLIIADYIYRYDAVINEIIKQGEQSRHHHIRLLVLDHVLDGELINFVNDPHGRRAYGPNMAHLKSRERFVHPTLYLEKADNRMGILQDIIAYVSGKNKDSDEVKKALAQIQAMGEEDGVANNYERLFSQTTKGNETNKQAAAHPLFAALIGQALKDPKQLITHWKRQDLIDYYLHTSNRLPWAKQKDKQEVDGEWIGAFVAAATIQRGMSFDALRGCLPDGKEYTDDEFDRIKSWCWRIVSFVDNEWLKPFVPDILGENFFLLFFQNFKTKPSVCDAFIRMLCAEENNQGNEKVLLYDIDTKYIDFVQHLARNLANEEQESFHVQKAWKTLAAFLNSIPYSDSPLRLTLSFAIMAVSDILEEKGLSHLNASFLPQVNVDDLVAASKGLIYCEVTNAFTKYFDRCNEAQRNQSAIQDGLNTIYLNFEERNGYKRLMVASHLGCLNTVKFFISQHNIDINATDDRGVTALMYASMYGHKAIVTLLLMEGAKERINESDGCGRTALMHASENGHGAIVTLLLKEGAKEKINEVDEMGETALMYASKNGHEVVVALLLKEGAKEKINEVHIYYGVTALIYACTYNHEAVVTLLLKEGAKERINHRDQFGMTALMYASENGYETIVALLIKAGANSNNIL